MSGVKYMNKGILICKSNKGQNVPSTTHPESHQVVDKYPVHWDSVRNKIHTSCVCIYSVQETEPPCEARCKILILNGVANFLPNLYFLGPLSLWGNLPVQYFSPTGPWYRHLHPSFPTVSHSSSLPALDRELDISSSCRTHSLPFFLRSYWHRNSNSSILLISSHPFSWPKPRYS